MKNKTVTPKQAGKELRLIIQKLKSGADYDYCKEEAEPFIGLINRRSEELSKKFGLKTKKISFTSVSR